MNRLILTTLMIFSYSFFAFGQFKPNSIGICYLQKETIDEYYLTISLPIQTLINRDYKIVDEFKSVIDTLTYSGEINFFDNKGELYRISNEEKFLVTFWCENDGGIQFRPTLNIVVKKNRFKRPLKGINDIQNICCFIILNKNEIGLDITDLKSSGDIKLTGDLNQDGKFECTIWTRLDDAFNCDGEPDNNLMIYLKVGEKNYRLRCCGP